MEHRRTHKRVKNEWSLSAGVLGCALTLLLATINDLQMNLFLALVFPAVAVASRLILTFHVSPGPWAITTWVILCSLADGLWFMAVAETFRLLAQRFKSSPR